MKGAGDYVKVLDFSVAKIDTPDAQVTRAGRRVRNARSTCSPEQGRGIPLDARVGHLRRRHRRPTRCSPGKPPFDGKVPTEVVMMHLRDKPAPLVGFPEPIAAMVMRALEKTPDRRQQSAEEFDRDIQACLETLYPRPSQALNIVGSGPTPSTPQPAVPPLTPPLGQPAQGGQPVQGMQVGQNPPNPIVQSQVARPDQRTMMAQPAPVLPQQQNYQGGQGGQGGQGQPVMPQAGQPGQAGGGRTMALNAPGPINMGNAGAGGPAKTMAFNPGAPNQGSPDGMGTMFIPDGPMGMSPQVLEAQRQAIAGLKKPPPPPSPRSGWAGRCSASASAWPCTSSGRTGPSGVGRPRRPSEGEATVEALRFHTRAIDKLDESVDPELRRRLSAWEGSPLIRELKPLPQSHCEPKVHVDPRLFYAGYLGVRGEVEIPYELRRDLKEQVPQALLRDLHRVVRPEMHVSRQQMEVDLDPAGAAAYKEAKAALKREPLPVLTLMLEVVMEEQARRRRFLAEPWKPFRPDEEERFHGETAEGF